ncbi:MAG: hypothetical protein IJ137_04105 [Eubacterium sp.]|nr:hypothetical protein [Eubacterium sp.]
MGKIDKNNVFIQNLNKRDRLYVFQDKLKRHLSNEYLYIVEQKDELESQLVQLKVEHSQKNKTLFPNIEQKDVRKYFSPLNIQEIEEDQKDEKDRQMLINIERLEDEINQLNTSMHEIKEFLRDIDELLDPSAEETAGTVLEGMSASINKDHSLIIDDMEEIDDGEDTIYQQNGDNSSENVDFFHINSSIYPQMVRNLYDYADYIKNEYNQIEVLIEFNDNNIETDIEENRNLLRQVDYNVRTVMEEYDVSTILITGEVTAKKVRLSLNYVCDQEEIEAMNVNYGIDRTHH